MEPPEKRRRRFKGDGGPMLTMDELKNEDVFPPPHLAVRFEGDRFFHPPPIRSLNQPVCYLCQRIFWPTSSALRLFASLEVEDGVIRWDHQCSQCCMNGHCHKHFLRGSICVLGDHDRIPIARKALGPWLPPVVVPLVLAFLQPLRGLQMDPMSAECSRPRWKHEIVKEREARAAANYAEELRRDKLAGRARRQRRITDFF